METPATGGAASADPPPQPPQQPQDSPPPPPPETIVAPIPVPACKATPEKKPPTGWTRGSGRRIIVGVCARDKKARSKAMTEILSRLDKRTFEVIIFGDQCILHQEVDKWPYCDTLIAFYSSGFPLHKVEQYAELVKPYILNDLKMQRVLHDRRKVYDILQENNIDVPVHAYLNRDGSEPAELEEFDEYIVVNGTQINKPLVEKPVDAEDHNVYIYYPLSMGGGSKRLFRKIGDRSSEFYPEINEVRAVGSYIYEEFVETQGTDVKVYTVGPDYGHAEARKSPVVDGKVNRNEEGKEIRYPVILSAAEKEIARKVCLAFKQTVCGFDLLRVQGRSYVCDVNGWSFVKNTRKYYDDCAQLLAEYMQAALEPGKISGLSAIGPLYKRGFLGGSRKKGSRPMASSAPGPDMARTITPPITSPRTTSGRSSRTGSPDFKDRADPSNKEELRCVIAIIRHGDRTPKQKMKMMTSYAGYLSFYHKYTSEPHKDVKIKSKHQLLDFLGHTKAYIATLQAEAVGDEGLVGKDVDMELLYKLHQIRDVLERSKIAGFNRKLQLKPRSFIEVTEEVENASGVKEVVVKECCSELMLILKWGGDLTKLGEAQAERLGAKFTQTMYPDPTGGGILRLHSTFRHDLKIKASDEGRVLKTAAAFTKGMLELEGELTPILVSLVHREKQTIHMLDPSGNNEIKRELEACKHHLHTMMQQDIDLSEEDINAIVPVGQSSIKVALRYVKNPRKTLFRMRELINFLSLQLEEMVKSRGLLLEPLSRTGSYSTLSSFISAALLADTTARHSPKRDPLERGVQQMSSLSLNSAQGSTVMGLDNGSNDSQPKEPSPSPLTGSSQQDGGFRDRHLHTPQSLPLDPVVASKRGNDDPRYRSRTVSGATDVDGYYYSGRFEEGSMMDSRSEAGESLADYAWRTDGNDMGDNPSLATTPANQTRSNSIVQDLMPVSQEPYGGETLILMLDRWKKLYKDLYNKKADAFDLSKVPDVHDNIRYDLLHNWHLGLKGMDELHELAQHLADCIVPQEYGVDKEEKRILGSHMCQALLEKIKYDMIIARRNDSFDVRYNLDMDHAEDLPINSLGRRVRTRLYFTSESHLHSLLNVLRFPEDGQLCSFSDDGNRVIENTSELCYLTHVVFRMFEDLDKHEDDPTRFRIEILFSPGCTAHPPAVAESEAEHHHVRYRETSRWTVMNQGMTWDDLDHCLDNAMKIGRKKPSLPRSNAKSASVSLKDGFGSHASLGPKEGSLSSATSGGGGEGATTPSSAHHTTAAHVRGGGGGGGSVESVVGVDQRSPASCTPVTHPPAEGYDHLFLEQGVVDGTPVVLQGAANALLHVDHEADPLLSSSLDAAELDKDLQGQRSRSGSIIGPPSSALLSGVAMAVGAVIGGVMLLNKNR